MIALLLVSLVAAAYGDITGSNPAQGSCICVGFTDVNVRDAGCGNVIGSANPPQCFKSTGRKQNCDLSGANYDFFEVEYGGRGGWMAGTFLDMGDDSRCNTGGTGACANTERVLRSEWGARPPSYNIGALPNKPVGMAFVHHTVTAACTTKDACMAQMRSIQNFHMDGNGWPDVGYNWLVGEDGRAYEGRGWDKIGAHTLGYNDVGVAVSVIGDYTGRVPNAAAQAAVQNTFDCAIQQGILQANHELFGHRDAGCTACPGDSLYPLIQTWPQYSFRDIPNFCRKDEHDYD